MAVRTGLGSTQIVLAIRAEDANIRWSFVDHAARRTVQAPRIIDWSLAELRDDSADIRHTVARSALVALLRSRADRTAGHASASRLAVDTSRDGRVVESAIWTSARLTDHPLSLAAARTASLSTARTYLIEGRARSASTAG